MRMLRRGAAALRRAVPSLAWGQHALATQRALAKLLRVFEPTRRLLGRAFNTLCDTADGMARMHRQRRRALNVWRDGCASGTPCRYTLATHKNHRGALSNFYLISPHRHPRYWRGHNTKHTHAVRGHRARLPAPADRIAR